MKSEKVSLQSLLTEPRPKNFEENRGHQPRLYTTSNAVAGQPFHFVLKRYGVTVLEPCPNQGCTKSFTMPRVIHYLRCGCPATTRLDTKAIRCDCTKPCPNQGCTRSFTVPRVIHYLRCGWPAKKRFILQRYGVTVLELARAKFARNWKAILLKLICTKTFTDGFFTL